MDTATAIQTNIVISQAAFSGASFKEAIDLALVTAAFDQKITLIFVDEGIFNLIANQNATPIADITHTDILNGLEYYDIDEIWVEKESLQQAGVSPEQLIASVSLVSRQDILSANRSAHHLVNF